MSRYGSSSGGGGGGGGGGGDRDRGRDRRDAGNLACKVYVGDLPRDASEKDVEHAFSYYGTLRSVWVARNPPGFAFVEFEDSRDAEDAVRGLDGRSFSDSRIRVEHSTGKVRPKPWMRRGAPRSRRAFNPDDRCYECGERGHYAYDCRHSGRSRRSRSREGGSRRSGGRRSYSRSRSRSYSRSPKRSKRSRSGSQHSHHSHHNHSPAHNGNHQN
ncbi:serine/arginine-rich splicing factor 7-like isoform X2 [Tubulanus polymorphus]|uniref:serine/arginine-rich splicing factor 7-like isoform X2 n=1 Tax=Tubulanus polymorphus TaxID=672921 RepID=UPI003DA43257